jgi:hypothetical protein
MVGWQAVPAGGGQSGAAGGGFLFGASGPGVADGSMQSWLAAHQVDYASTFSDSSLDGQLNAYPLWPQFDYGYPQWQKGVELAVGGIYPAAQGDSWAGAASGALDSRWQQSANTIKGYWQPRPFNQLTLGFARELNGNFSAWQVNDGQEADFRTAWGRWQNIVKATMPGVRTVLTFNAGTSSLTTVTNLWPSATPPDFCGVDTYNTFPHITDAAGWTSKINQVIGANPVGLERWRLQAATWGVPLAVSEWSNAAINVGDGGGGGDDPYWTSQMLAYFYANAGTGAGQVAYAGFFNEGAAEGYPQDYTMFRNGSANPAQPLNAAVLQANAHSVAGGAGGSTTGTRTAVTSQTASTVGLGNLTMTMVIH